MLHSNQCKIAINKPRYLSMSHLCEQDLACGIAKKSMHKNKQENRRVCLLLSNIILYVKYILNVKIVATPTNHKSLALRLNYSEYSLLVIN